LSPSGGNFPSEEQSGSLVNQNKLWEDDDDELASPVICQPGAYRCVCSGISIHNLAIAALTDSSFSQNCFHDKSGGRAESFISKQCKNV
jgi:hypothetical protein